MIEKLRAATREQHVALENKLFSNKISNLSLEKKELILLLKINYNYYSEIEKLTNQLSKYQINRAQFAKQDLSNMNETSSVSLPFDRDNMSLSFLYGVLYVSLGATLGSKMIASKLEKNENIDTNTFSFYQNTDHEFQLWKTFLNEIKENTLQLDEENVIDGAQKSFAYFDDISKIFLQIE